MEYPLLPGEAVVTGGIKVKDGKVMLDKAQVVKTDIPCKNGVIHVIDTVIMPKEAPAKS